MPELGSRALLILTFACVCAALGQVLFKLGAGGRQSLSELINPVVVAGLVAYGAGTLLWIIALSRAPLRVVYPFTALTFVLVYLGAAVILGERISLRGAIGVAVVLAGLAIIVGDSA